MNSTQQYRDALSQGMTPCEAEQWIAEEEEYERIERETDERIRLAKCLVNAMQQEKK